MKLSWAGDTNSAGDPVYGHGHGHGHGPVTLTVPVTPCVGMSMGIFTGPNVDHCSILSYHMLSLLLFLSFSLPFLLLLASHSVEYLENLLWE